MTVKRQPSSPGGSELRAEAFLASIPCAAALWTIDFTQCALNVSALSLFDFVASEAGTIPELWVAQVHEEDRQAYAQFRERATSGGLSSSGDFRFIPRNGGALRWIREFSNPFTAATSNCTWHLSSLYVNISDLKGLRSSIAMVYDLDDIINGLFHDTQNDLHRVAMELELARMGLADLSDLAHTHDTIYRLENEVKDLRGYISPLQQPMSPCDASAVLDGVAASLQLGNRRSGIKVLWAVSPSLPILSLHQKLFARAIESLIEFCVDLMHEQGELRITAEPLTHPRQTYAEIRFEMISTLTMSQEDVEQILAKSAEFPQVKSGFRRAVEVLRRHDGEIFTVRHGNCQLELNLRLKAAPL